MTITVIHEVRWLPNDVETKLARMQATLDTVLGILQGMDQEKIDALAAALKPEADALEQSSKNQ